MLTEKQIAAAFIGLEGWPSALRESDLNNVADLAAGIETVLDAYRTGQLIAVQGDEVERVARALTRLKLGNFSDKVLAQSQEDALWHSYTFEANIVISAMKGNIDE